MKTYSIDKEGTHPVAFEIDHIYLSRGTIARRLKTVKGVTDVHVGGRFGSSNDIRVEFKYLGRDYIVMEPYGDNSRYWIGPKEGKDGTLAAGDVGEIKGAFDKYTPSLPVKIFGDLVSLNLRALFRR